MPNQNPKFESPNFGPNGTVPSHALHEPQNCTTSPIKTPPFFSRNSKSFKLQNPKFEVEQKRSASSTNSVWWEHSREIELQRNEAQ
jgi:hypothetical protein